MAQTNDKETIRREDLPPARKLGFFSWIAQDELITSRKASTKKGGFQRRKRSYSMVVRLIELSARELITRIEIARRVEMLSLDFTGVRQIKFPLSKISGLEKSNTTLFSDAHI